MPRPYCLLWLIPLVGFAQIQTGDDLGVAVDPGAVLRHRAAVHYPKDLILGGTVELEASLNAGGEVSDAHVVSGPEELRKEALTSVLQWHYAPGSPSPVRISIRFDSALITTRPTRIVMRQVSDLPVLFDFGSGVLKSMEFSGLGPAAENELRACCLFAKGRRCNPSDLRRIRDIVRGFDDHLVANITGQIAAPDAHRDLIVHIQTAAPGSTVFIAAPR